MRTYDNHSLLSHNTFGIDVRCRQFIEVSSTAALQRFIEQRNADPTDSRPPLLALGRGSNILFTKDFDGIVLHSSIRGYDANIIGDYVMLRCGSGEVWDDMVQAAIDNGWHGIENLSLIPGEVGAAAVQNIGAYGAEVKDVVFSVEAVDLPSGEVVHIPVADCQYGYRHSRFKDEWRGRYFITHVTLRLSTIFRPDTSYKGIEEAIADRGLVKPTPQQLRDIVCELRRQKLPDPKTVGNAGSFFKNPIITQEQHEALHKQYPHLPAHPTADGQWKLAAAWLIEQSGWKGVSMGDAAVWEAGPLVIANLGTTQADDILQLAQAITEDIEKKFHITLSPEVNII